MSEESFEYDVCLSFAGEQRAYVEAVNVELEASGVRVFYDEAERASLWGKDLYSHLAEIYQFKCRYCVMFISQEYASKRWPTHERKSAQARALADNQNGYILPARFDDTPIPGLLDTTSYIDLRQKTSPELAALIREKLGVIERRNYLPPVLDRLFEMLQIQDEPDTQETVHSIAHRFLETLYLMTPEERNTVFALFLHGCPVESPDNIHIRADLLHRVTGHSVPRLKQILAGLSSLGFACSFRQETEEDTHVHEEVLGESHLFELTWDDFSVEYDGSIPCLPVAEAMIKGATEDYCEVHGMAFLERLDFSQLSQATATIETHG